MADPPLTPMDEDHDAPLHPLIDAMMTVSMRAHAFFYESPCLLGDHPQGGGRLCHSSNHGGADKGDPGPLLPAGSTHKTRYYCAP
jgi:hypothetical protein